MSLLHDTTKNSIAFAIGFELLVHIFVHYTVPGANIAAGIAKALAPIMDGIGLTSVFSQAASDTTAQLATEALPDLGTLAM